MAFSCSSRRWTRTECFLLVCPLLLVVFVGGGLWLRRLMTLNLQSLAYLPDGNIVCAYRDTRVVVLDGKTGRHLRTLGTVRSANALAFALSPDGKSVAVQGKTGNESMILDIGTGEVRHTFAIRQGIWAAGTDFSGDGKLAIVQSGSSTWIFDSQSGKLRTTLEDTGGESAFAFQNQKTVICATNDLSSKVGLSRLGVRDIRTGNWTQIWERGGASVGSVVLSPDKSLAAIASYEPVEPTSKRPVGIRLYATRSGKRLRTFNGDGWFSCLRFSPDGTRLAASLVNTARAWVWDVKTGQMLFTVEQQTPSMDRSVSLAWSPDGDTLLIGSADDTLSLWDGHSGQSKRFAA